jgi:hypothetical protein
MPQLWKYLLVSFSAQATKTNIFKDSEQQLMLLGNKGKGRLFGIADKTAYQLMLWEYLKLLMEKVAM